MDQELKAKWIAALRSGDIKQARGELLNEKGEMCCVGVLGRLLGITDEALYQWRGFLGGCANSPGLDPLDKVGLPFGEIARLAGMNDGSGGKPANSFAEIAAHIEANL